MKALAHISPTVPIASADKAVGTSSQFTGAGGVARSLTFNYVEAGRVGGKQSKFLIACHNDRRVCRIWFSFNGTTLDLLHCLTEKEFRKQGIFSATYELLVTQLQPRRVITAALTRYSRRWFLRNGFALNSASLNWEKVLAHSQNL